MPITPTYPGVYIEEVPSGVHTITGVATSIAAFFGRTAKGPLNKAIRCFNYSDFTRAFGGAHQSSDLAQIVRQFFNNGGTDTYVIRLAKGAKAASLTLKARKGTGTINVLKAKAKAEGSWGNTVRINVDYNTPNPDDTFNLRVIHEESGKVVGTEDHTNLTMNPFLSRFAPDFVTDSSNLITLELHDDVESTGTTPIKVPANSIRGFSQARRPLSTKNIAASGGHPQVPAKSVHDTLDELIHPTAAGATPRYKFEISVNESAYAEVDLSSWVVPATPILIATGLEGLIRAAIQDVDPSLDILCKLEDISNIGHILSIISITGDESSVRVRSAGSNDLAAALMLGVQNNGIEPVRWNNFRPVPNGWFIDFVFSDPSVVDFHKLEDLDKIARITKSNFFNKITINGDDVDLVGDYSLDTTEHPNFRWFKSKKETNSIHDNNDGIREKFRIIVNAINNEIDLEYKAEVWGYHLAILAKTGTINQQPTGVATTPAVTQFTNSFEENTRLYSLGQSSQELFCLKGDAGDDGSSPTKSEYVGNEEKQTGFHALDVVDLFNLMVLPADEDVDLTDIWGPASIYCQKNRAFLLVDAPTDWTNSTTGLADVVQDTTMVGDLRATVTNINSAVFYPRLVYKSNGLIKLTGPSGAIAGLMARTDADRGVWKAPAGTESDIRGIIGLEVKLTDMENGVLNKLAVNCLREFPGSYVNWGSRTMDGYDNNSKDDWKYIPVRRLALFLEESLFRGTKWVVFEPNDEPLWAKIRLNVGAFMNRLFRQGAFQGSTPDKAYYVKCDSETTTQADINLGIVNIEVGFAPLKPAEFVIIKIQQIMGEL